MLKLLVLILLSLPFSPLAKADQNLELHANTPRAILGLSSVGSELGFSLEAITPFFLIRSRRVAWSFQFSEFQFSGVPLGQTRPLDLMYTKLQLNGLGRLWENDTSDLYTKFGVFLIPGGSVSSRSGTGISFSLGMNWFKSSSFLNLVTELGYSFPIDLHADKIDGSAFARGMSGFVGFRVTL